MAAGKVRGVIIPKIPTMPLAPPAGGEDGTEEAKPAAAPFRTAVFLPIALVLIAILLITPLLSLGGFIKGFVPLFMLFLSVGALCLLYYFMVKDMHGW